MTAANLRSTEEAGLIRCGSVEYEQYLKQKYPKRKSRQEFETWLESKKSELFEAKTFASGSIQTIPVIFHIITDGSGSENLSELSIQSQIDQLNIDYRNLAESVYSQAKDAEIEFCLAQQDENGIQLAEAGINRITNYGDDTFLNTFVENTIKPNTFWDPTKYLNIWVVGGLTNGSDDLLGYAQFPDSSGLDGLNDSGGLSSTDGVVIIASTVGSLTNPNPNGGNYDSGRTLSHEIGHWLGLRHIWGDSSSCTNDDYCADTPDASDANYGCPTLDSCPNDGLGNDMVQNYMDYTDDSCMNTFTSDQVARMLTVLANSPRRLELVTTSVACQPGQIFDLDGSIDIMDLNLVECGYTITPNIKVTNRGNITLTSATIKYFTDSNSPIAITWNGNLAYNESAIITLPTLNIGPGLHTFTVELVSPNGSSDQETANNSSTSNSFAAYFETTSVNLSLIPDNYGSEITWQFRDINNNVLYSGGPYPDDDSTPINEVFEVSEGECYTFIIYDLFEDGICCQYGEGSYKLTTDDGDIIRYGGQYAAFESTTFGIGTDLDTDNDGVSNSFDNCVDVANPDQADFDGDGRGDACDEDIDGDGVLNMNDQCDWTPIGETVNVQGCKVFTLPPDNFFITINAETCRFSEDGAIFISAEEALEYMATLSPVSKSKAFTENTSFENLESGNYELCITVVGEPDYEQCYNIVISEPEDLSVYARVDYETGKMTMTLFGSEQYTILHNESIWKSKSNSVEIKLAQGVNTVVVKTDKECQGTFNKTVYYYPDEKIHVFPNPVGADEYIYVIFGKQNTDITQVKLFDIMGKQVANWSYNPGLTTVKISTQQLSSGLYILKVYSMSDSKSFKILKY